ncbi:sensor histidine kinase [Streptomyces griseus]|uniref:sensor histidine kinase n=1 Tax=Streptomyces griseus TaxID=1911 RepID=UPI00068AC186|nr:ATP-binding protein [Streptomyces griseus]
MSSFPSRRRVLTTGAGAALGVGALGATATPATAAVSTGSRQHSGPEETRTLDELYRDALAEGGGVRSQADGTADRVRFRSVGEDRPALDAQSEATLFRVAQGTLANLREHARAVDVRVTLRQEADRVELEVSDDGVGFDPAAPPPAPRPARGLGLPAARARLRECGGDLDLDLDLGSAPGRGTRVRAVVPALSGPPEDSPAAGSHERRAVTPVTSTTSRRPRHRCGC